MATSLRIPVFLTIQPPACRLRPALFGRDWLSQRLLNWGEIKVLKLSKTPERVMQQKVDLLLQQYESVFSEVVGTLKGHNADLKVEEGCQSSFQSHAKFHMHSAPRLKQK